MPLRNATKTIWWASMLCSVALVIEASAQITALRLISTSEVFGTLKSGSMLHVSNIVAITETEYVDGVLNRLSWDRPGALEMELDGLLRQRDSGLSASNALIRFVRADYRRALEDRFLIEMLNRAFPDAEILKICPDYTDPMPNIARLLERSREYLDLFAAENRAMPQEELQRRFEAFFTRTSAAIPPEERAQLVAESVRKWREKAEQSNLMAIRRHMLMGLSRDSASKSNTVWMTERANWIRRLCYTKMAQQEHLAAPTPELTNKFLWPRAKRYPCVSLYSKKMGALAPFQLDLLEQPTAQAMIGRLDFLVSRSENWKTVLRTNYLVAPSLLRIDPGIRLPDGLPRLVYRTVQADEIAVCQEWVNRSLLPPAPIEVLLILSEPVETVSQSMAKLPEGEWRKFLSAEGVIHEVYANIRGQFETINTNLFPTAESIRSWLPPEGMSAFLLRSQ